MDLELEGFCHTLKSKFSVVARVEEVGWENIEHYRNELDVELFPKFIFDNLPDPCVFQVMVFTDKESNDWMLIVPIHPTIKERICTIWLKNSEIVDWEKIEEGK
ncbi:hypothetical protein A6280_10620 [Bacillus wiedmannii]|uniref:hypothetical protein n=1 Tax=Bacillus wiedmannii TaxID=1890302 RepID=UPI0007DB54AF|nr:hypothetical protein [Bacillus wiedmannii]OAK03201.1 hypothetical protein A6280_10620 [Bacillus wiedmannii]